ncbi:MAG TPA: homoserine O-succinyltransferase [Chitinivibrionales bacterium]|nr:homoserine O-succinyltransferase [Chitinivibrionales bacterium]
MTIVLQKDYHAKAALEQRRVLCIDHEQALKEDIRALRIGILNIMPQAERYEFSLLYPLGRSVLQIEPIWIRLATHTYTSTDQSHLDKLYVPFEDAVARNKLDGLIVTGAPVEEIPFEQVTYWNEILRILRYAQRNIASTLGLCWGGLAIAKFLGMEKVVLPNKQFGVFQTFNLDRDHRVTGDMDDVFWCPQSRHSGIPDAVLEAERDKGKIKLLAHSKETGYVIFESSDQRFLMHLGHLEYEPSRLIEEYKRDLAAGRTDVESPKNFDLESPVNTWRAHRNEFFSQWIKFIHETTQY